MNKLELENQLGRIWENSLLEYFEDEMRAPSLEQPLMANLFVRTTGQLMFKWSLSGVALEALTSHNKPKLGDTGLRIYQMLAQHIARGNSGLSLGEEERSHLFLEMNHVDDTRYDPPGM